VEDDGSFGSFFWGKGGGSGGGMGKSYAFRLWTTALALFSDSIRPYIFVRFGQRVVVTNVKIFIIIQCPRLSYLGESGLTIMFCCWEDTGKCLVGYMYFRCTG